MVNLLAKFKIGDTILRLLMTKPVSCDKCMRHLMEETVGRHWISVSKVSHLETVCLFPLSIFPPKVERRVPSFSLKKCFPFLSFWKKKWNLNEKYWCFFSNFVIWTCDFDKKIYSYILVYSLDLRFLQCRMSGSSFCNINSKWYDMCQIKRHI